MRQFAANCRRANGGFTLVELLTVVAITIVLLAIAIPSIVILRTELKMLELDSYAKSIYVTAQNRLISMKATGELAGLPDIMETSYADRNLGTLDAMPKDYVATDEGWKHLYYISEGDDVTKGIMKVAVISSAIIDGRHYIMEVNPANGELYSVFFTEAATLSYSDVQNLASRGKTDRKSIMLGYYCGDAASVAGLPSQFSPTVTVTNDEELYLSVQCSGFINLILTQQNVTITLDVADENGNTWQKVFRGGTDFTITGDSINLDVLLDSMRSGYSLAQITEGALTPGDNLTIDVKVAYDRDAVHIIGNQLVTANGLFESKDVDGNITVSAVRHLNNLRETIFPFNSARALNVTQTQDIDFLASTWSSDSISTISKQANIAAGSSTEIVNPLSSFTPLVNDRLFGNASAGYATFSGEGNSISNFIISSGGATGTGLFAMANGITIENTYLIDPQVTGAANTGALVGRMTNGTISYCGVHLSVTDEYDRNRDDMDDRVGIYTVKSAGGSTAVGGLVGSASGTAIVGSFAALNVLAESGSIAQIGGLIGTLSNGSIESSYSSGDIIANNRAGGLVGVVSGSDIRDSYSTSDVVAESYGGGLIGVASSGTYVEKVNSYGIVLKADETVDIATSDGFVGSTSSSTYSQCFYLDQTDYNRDFTAIRQGISRASYASLRVYENDLGNSHPYNEDLVKEKEVFPFLMVTNSEIIKIDHWGNWPTEYKIRSSLVYYEKYTDGSFGYYAITGLLGIEDADHAMTLDTLRDEHCVDDGYALMTIYDLERFECSLNEAANTSITISATASSSTAVLLDQPASLEFTIANGDTIGIEYLYVYQLPFELQETTRDITRKFFDQLEMTGYAQGNSTTPVFEDYTFFYCPHFAKNAINPAVGSTIAGRPVDPTVVYVRSARQLNALGRFVYYWNINNNGIGNQFIYTQETDIDFAKYDKTYCGLPFDLMDTSSANPYANKPIGRPMYQDLADNFQNVYDGQSNKIIDYCVECRQEENYQFVGLFGEIYKAELRNIIMMTNTNGSAYVRSHYHYNSTERSSGTGALVGLVYTDKDDTSALVQNCSVSGYEVTYNTGTMNSNCAVGGLVGYNMGEIVNSSAVCKLVQVTVTRQSDNIIASIGGLVGSNYSIISKSYAGGRLWYANTHNNRKAPVEIGGLAGKCSYLYTTRTDFVNTITDCYSYSTIASVGSGSRFEYYGVSVRSIDTGAEQYVSGDILTMTNCYYLSTTAPATIITTQTGATPLDYAWLSSLAISGFSKATAANSYPYNTALAGMAFPFLAIVNVDGAVVHYGNWYVPDITGLALSAEEEIGSALAEDETVAGVATSGGKESYSHEDDPTSSEDDAGLGDDTASGEGNLTKDSELGNSDSTVDAGDSQ